MSAKPEGCKSCGSEFESIEGYIVCTGCGRVSDEKTFADDPTQTFITNDTQLFRQQTVHASIRNEIASKTTQSRKMGIKIAETLAVNYHFSSEMKEYLMRYYNKAINHQNFFKCSQKNKEILAAVCAYITLMNYNESIAIQHVCGTIGCDGHDFGQIYKQFVQTFPESKPTANPIEKLVPSVLMDFDFDKEEKIKLIQRVIDIINIEKACWLIEGRSPLHLISAATYIGWKSLKPSDRAKVKFTQFCNRFHLIYRQTTSNRIKELNDVFIKLANLIPTVKYRSIVINKNNIAEYIDDIVNYSNSLIFDLRRDVFLSISKNNCPQDNDEHYNAENDTNWMNSFKRKRYCNKDEKSIHSNITLYKENEDTYISDAEIDGYIRSEEEIKVYRKLQKRAKRCEANE